MDTLNKLYQFKIYRLIWFLGLLFSNQKSSINISRNLYTTEMFTKQRCRQDGVTIQKISARTKTEMRTGMISMCSSLAPTLFCEIIKMVTNVEIVWIHSLLTFYLPLVLCKILDLIGKRLTCTCLKQKQKSKMHLESAPQLIGVYLSPMSVKCFFYL